MKPWIRLTLVAMTVGGGFAGFAFTLQSLLSSLSAPILNIALTLIFLGLYGFVVVSGLMFVHDARRTDLLVAALAIQIPSISSSVFTYRFAAGLEAVVSIGQPESANLLGVHFGWNLLIGASWNVAFHGDHPLIFGVNCGALGMLLLLLRAQQPSPNMVAPTTDRPMW